jgi:glucose-fructose oxidoreductase
MKAERLTRRSLLKRAAAGAIAAPYLIRSSALGNAAKEAASERVTLGHIGVGGRGSALLRGFLGLKNAQSVAFADSFKTRRDGWAEKTGGKAYADFRELLARDDIDAVVVATPDHWHVPIANAAARAGKDAYVEKPLGISVLHDQTCRKVFQQYGRIFQYGTQQRSSEHCRFGCELVRSGRIGKVHTIEVVAPNGASGGSTEEIPVPPDLDYEMWLGPAPVAPYTKDRCTAQGAYHIYDYAIGFIAGWGAHPLDILQWGYDTHKAGVAEFEGTGDIPTEGLFNTVINWNVRIQYANGLKMTFTPGGDSTKFIGKEGWVQVRRGGIDAEPKSLLESTIGPNDVHLTVSTNHAQNFVDCVKSRATPVSNLDDAVHSDIISHMGDICIRLGRKITWDPVKEEIIGDEEASRMLSRPMRPPWTM